MTTISLIVPCYNAARTLRLCLESALSQTRPPDEIVVVDDASTDGSAAIAEGLGCRVIRLPENRGVSAARNAGVEHTTGDVVFFLDSDVALRPDAVANAVEILQRDPGYGCVHGIYDTEPLIDDGPIERYRILHAVHWRRRQLGEVGSAVFALAAVRREALLAAGRFDEGLRDSEDVEYSSRLALRCRIVLTDAVAGRHDDGSRLLPILTEQWRRALPVIPLMARAAARGTAGDAKLARANRPAGILACGLAMASLPLAALHPALLAAPAAAVTGFVLADPELLRFVHRQRGTAFTAYFMAVHLAVHVVLVAGLAAGSPRAIPSLHAMVRKGRPIPGR
ncbi:glycosyltransferase family 2 protein [Planomonospora sp. ID91781]|uniref:glycosyltransferase family 2 protein n=1 Tax=Planomonospora sp. ID91781 TaxID=2738135 RepID=UPI0018C3A347|nr:glycosyltransferase family 2 protein [Planomonospora sp. ID91781]MBG0822872.1 glycosyltransferase family 2 protein [Planomonospora sp. ID91781]